MVSARTSSAPAFAGEGSHPKGGGGALLRASRRALLGGPDAPERLREADEENEARERSRGLTVYLLAVLAVALLFALSWSESLSDLWNLVWFIPLVLFGGLIWYGFEALGGAVCRRAASPFRTNTYTPNFYGDEDDDGSDFAMAEIVDDEAEPGEAARWPH